MGFVQTKQKSGVLAIRHTHHTYMISGKLRRLYVIYLDNYLKLSCSPDNLWTEYRYIGNRTVIHMGKLLLTPVAHNACKGTENFHLL